MIALIMAIVTAALAVAAGVSLLAGAYMARVAVSTLRAAPPARSAAVRQAGHVATADLDRVMSDLTTRPDRGVGDELAINKYGENIMRQRGAR